MRRSAILILSVFVAAIVLFLLLRLLPGDPANALVSVGADAAQIEAARKQVGSDLPLYQQFTQFIGSLVRFDLGNSFVSGAPVLTEIGKRLIVTLPLTLMAFVLAIIIAVPLGILSVVRQKSWYGSIISVISQLGIAVPVFWIGILLVWVFAVKLRMFPSGGFPSRGWQSAPAAFQSLTLPVVTIAIVMSASLIRYVRSATQDVLGSDYLRTARALGSTFSQALIRHGIRNGAVPVISILGIELASTLLGAVVVERVFSLPGLGSMLLLGIEQRDYPNVQGVLFVSTLLVLLVGFAADLVQRLIDPRLRSRSAGGRA
ncbi:glutathione transport system permease protein GsiC [Brucella sp. NBRC 12952]|uniref:Binding-protein-dependent transport system inner membrane component family protein n=1 Tax=Brucella pseudogrignonensis TaxID=419475 RepID=A0A256GH75_9HYPH|nr:binding-protein-dependent transport system inner membrane protein [Ochrobactrum sp. CDB2]OYR26505.1 binding-protein-dependent transport system inner membrane component family protein [Brucella pseudogrignonensis]